MNVPGWLRYSAGAATAAVVTGFALLAVVVTRDGWPTPWSLAGWTVAATGGIATGARLEAVHGSEGPAFVVAFAACMLARLLAYAVGGTFAVSRGTDAVWAYLAGLGAAYVPTQAFEILWFWRKTIRSHT